MNNSFLNNLDHETVIRKTDINKMTERRRFKLIGLAVLFLLIALTLVFTSKEANAERPVKRIKQVVSVRYKGEIPCGVLHLPIYQMSIRI